MVRDTPENQISGCICRQSLVSKAHVVLIAVSRHSLVNYVLERNLGILRMHNATLRLHMFSNCAEHMYTYS